MSYNRERQKENRRLKKLRGECQNCSKPVVEGKQRCQRHLDYQNNWVGERRSD